MNKRLLVNTYIVFKGKTNDDNKKTGKIIINSKKLAFRIGKKVRVFVYTEE